MITLYLTADLCFGFPFGMIGTAQDSAPVALAQDDVIASYGRTGPEFATARFPAVEVINGRGEFSATMGVLPPLLRPYVKRLPWFSRGQTAVRNLAGLAVAAVSKRLTQGEVESGRVDFLTKLSSTKDNSGEVMGKEELTAEALTLLVAGSDTTSK
jgi:benzoate 4-monooxygenase